MYLPGILPGAVGNGKTKLDPTSNVSESLLAIMNHPTVTSSPFQSKFSHALQALSNPLTGLSDTFLRFEYDAYAVTHHITSKQMEYTGILSMISSTKKTGISLVQKN